MRSSVKDIPVGLEIPEAVMRLVEWGGMTIEVGELKGMLDPSAMFKGLPDDRCQCPHWGYVLKGRLRYRYADREEVYQAGDVYYAPPGHTPVLEAGTQYIEFSPSDKYAETVEVVQRNMAATGT